MPSVLQTASPVLPAPRAAASAGLPERREGEIKAVEIGESAWARALELTPGSVTNRLETPR